MPLAPNSGISAYLAALGGVPKIVLPDGTVVSRPHPEWLLHQLRWRWLLDSWEGGEVYRMAVYGYDLHGMPIRNLIRHKREYPSSFDSNYAIQAGRPAGTDQAAQATDDDYELRRARTPVPGFMAEVVESHLSKIFKREVKREGPDEITAWWKDVDNRGTTIDQFMGDTVAPLLLVLGQLDAIVEAPTVPAGETVSSRADEIRLKLDVPVASYILPENLVWWELDRRGRYKCCLIREVMDTGEIQWRYWTAEYWCLFDGSGKPIGPPKTEHSYGRVPIARGFDRKRPRHRNIGLPRYEVVAELQREYYNRDSELILSDTTQAHPLLQGPEDYVQPDGTVPIGPNWLLPKKKSSSGGAYEGFDVIDFPKGGAESIRTNKNDLRDAVDRAACLTKPAGAQGTDGGTVSQSGVSKRLDFASGNDLLGKVSRSLERYEQLLAELYWTATHPGNPAAAEAGLAATAIQYPTEFDLAGALELADITSRVQLILNSAGISPEVERPLITRLLRTALPGLDDEEYEAMDTGVDRVLATAANQPEAKESDEAEAAEAEAGGADAGEKGLASRPLADPQSAGKMIDQGGYPGTIVSYGGSNLG